jgi:hypothetical protein
MKKLINDLQRYLLETINTSIQDERIEAALEEIYDIGLEAEIVK